MSTGSQVDLNVGSASDLINVTGGFTISGTDSVNISSIGLAPGTYKFLDFGSGSALGGGSFSIGTHPAGTYTILGPSTGAATSHEFDLQVALTQNTWTGSDPASTPSSAAWNINSATNWTANSLKYLEGDAVTFGDGPTNRNIFITGTVNPSSVVANNSAGDYSITGVIGNGFNTGVSKSGTGTLTLSGLSTYTGQVGVKAGTLSVDSIADTVGSALGLGTSLVLGDTLGNTGGTLRYTGAATPITTARSILINGPVSGSTISTIDTGASNLTFNGAVTGLGGLNKAGAGTLTLGSTLNNNTGSVTVSNGTLSTASFAPARPALH